MKLVSFFSFILSLIKVRFKCFNRRARKCFKRNIIRSLPQVIKKQTLLVTLYLKGRNERIFDDIDMSELNKYMDIANDPKVLEFLVSLNEESDLYHFDFNMLLAKHNCVMDTKLDGDAVRQISIDIIDRIPVCLRYGKNEMIQDISGLLFKLPLNNLYSCRTAIV